MSLSTAPGHQGLGSPSDTCTQIGLEPVRSGPNHCQQGHLGGGRRNEDSGLDREHGCWAVPEERRQVARLLGVSEQGEALQGQPGGGGPWRWSRPDWPEAAAALSTGRLDLKAGR